MDSRPHPWIVWPALSSNQFVHVDAVFFHAVPDGDPADPQEGRGLGLVAAGLPQGLDQGRFFIVVPIRDGPGLSAEFPGESRELSLGGRCSGGDEAVSATTKAYSSAPLSSRTLPGQG